MNVNQRESTGRWVLAAMVAMALAASGAMKGEGNDRARFTRELQERIDRTSAAGGGRVTVSAGVHECGTIYLKSNVELHLEKGAELRGSAKSADYDDAIPRAEMYNYEKIAPESRTLKAFLFAQGASNVAITGKGVIEGRGPDFFDHNTVLWERFWAKPKVPRPRMLVLFDCRGIRLEGVTFKDCPIWTMWIRNCENVVMDDIVVDCEQKMINSDGIDFDCCRHVRVGNSRLRTGDDAFAIRAIRSRVDRTRPAITEDLVVSNCVVDAACQGVRIGCPSDDTIRNCTFRDIVFTGFNAIGSQQPTWYLETGDRGFLRTRDILFENWTIDCAGHAIEMFVSDGISLRDFGHMTFRNLRIVKAALPMVIRNGDKTEIRDLVFENVTGRPDTRRVELPQALRRLADDRMILNSK